MTLDDELESIEQTGQTDAEQIDEETEIQDVSADIDELLGADAEEQDLEHAYSSFETNNETDYNGYDPSEVVDEANAEEAADILHSEGYHIEDEHELEEELLEMEIEEGDIYAYLVDEDDNEIGFVLIDENGNEQQYLYVDLDDYEVVDEEGNPGIKVERESDGEEFDLGITREGVAETTADLNAIYKDGKEVLGEFKETIDDISEGMGFLKKK